MDSVRLSDRSAATHLALRLIGGVQLVADEAPVTGRAAQRRRMALLAYLARSPERRAHRDRLMGLLWTDHAPDAARRLLNESIYVIRRELGPDVLRTEGDTVRLDAAVVCDADLFDRAVVAGDLAGAVGLYAGPLFGSWSVGDAPEFEQWAETERAQFGRRFADVAPRAAAQASGRGDWKQAAAIFARLATEDPDSVIAAEGEARALAMAGEPLQACRRLDQFAERWAVEFGGTPPATVTALRTALVSGAVGAPVAARRVAASAAMVGAAGASPIPTSAAAEHAVAVSPVAARAAERRKRWWWIPLPLALVAVAIVWVSTRQNNEPVVGRASRVAIMSRALASRDTGLAYLREAITEGVTNQLSVNRFSMATSSEVRAMESGRLSLDSLVSLKQLGTLVEFAFEARPSRVRVTARLIDALSREVLSSSVFERPLDDALSIETDLTRFVVDALRQRLRQSVAIRDPIEGQRDATARKLLITAVRSRLDASEVLQNGFALDLEAARNMLLAADALLQRAALLEPTWDAVLLERARIMRERVRTEPESLQRALLDSAVAMTGAVLARRPEEAEAFELRGMLRMRTALALSDGARDTIALRDADTDLRRALALEPQRAEGWLALSTVQNLRGQAASSLISAQRAVEHDAFLINGQRAYFELFAGALTSAKVDEALQWCRRGRLAYPRDVTFYVCELTAMRERPAQPTDVVSAWRLVARVDSLSQLAERRTTADYKPAYSVVVAAGISARAGNAAMARDAVQRARRLIGSDPSLRLDLTFDEAWVELMLGDRRRAVSLLRQVVAARPPMARIITTAPLFRDIADDVLPSTRAAVPPTR